MHLDEAKINLQQNITKKSKKNDQYTLEIGDSRIIALPLGDGSKLRGFRFHRIIIDEFALMPERIYNEVIIPFLSVVTNPTQRDDLDKLETKLIEEGRMEEHERHIWPGNKLIALSSASYKFEYLYKLYQQFEFNITREEQKDSASRCIMHFSYDCAPKQLYDQNLLKQAKSTMSQSQFDREFGAIFTDDSAGYFKTSKMALCTVPDGESPSIEIAGDTDAEYILAFDPSWSQMESSDDFAIQVLKLNKEKQIGVVVHSYALAGANMREHIKYLSYILKAFNVVMVIGDYAGGVQFLSACNESEIFKKDNLKLKTIEVDFEKPEAYNSDLQKARNKYNKTEKKIVNGTNFKVKRSLH